jgi:hypothetical protein
MCPVVTRQAVIQWSSCWENYQLWSITYGERKRTITDQRILQRGNISRPFNPIRELSPAFNYTYESLFYEASATFDEGRQINEAKDHNEEFKKIPQEKRKPANVSLRTSQKLRTNHS